jgi:hypothetical protein
MKRTLIAVVIGSVVSGPAWSAESGLMEDVLKAGLTGVGAMVIASIIFLPYQKYRERVKKRKQDELEQREREEIMKAADTQRREEEVWAKEFNQ